MSLPVTFANLTTAEMVNLDQNFAALGALTPIPCTVSGTNTLAFTPLTNAPTISAYANYQPFVGISPSANTGSVTINVGSLGARSAYKDTPNGPALLSGGEIASGNLIYATFDATLNGGAGGFHVTALYSPAWRQGGESTITASTGTTLTAAQQTGAGTGQGFILRQGSPGGGFNDQSDTAANLVTAMVGAVVGTIFRFRVENTSGQTQTLTTNTGITLVGPVTTANNASHDYIGRVTALGTPAVTIYG
jgi:hypothetical protein